jgi:hypothetical protein
VVGVGGVSGVRYIRYSILVQTHQAYSILSPGSGIHLLKNDVITYLVSNLIQIALDWEKETTRSIL